MSCQHAGNNLLVHVDHLKERTGEQAKEPKKQPITAVFYPTVPESDILPGGQSDEPVEIFTSKISGWGEEQSVPNKSDTSRSQCRRIVHSQRCNS